MSDTFHDQIHQIREEIAREIADLSDEEAAEYINNLAEEFKKEMGITLPKKVREEQTA